MISSLQMYKRYEKLVGQRNEFVEERMASSEVSRSNVCLMLANNSLSYRQITETESFCVAEMNESCAWQLAPNIKNQGKGMLEVY